ncbi:unnamed protein product [Mycena citricolor]|uniref:MFS general substrate transporter n=1 Tax=Mycena citricolor TaxID=2018698 RepID=A0AAD2Q1T8_9AGAR|nr:unnamed protein product [Mycena citricolor]CAK5282005.1 unnamed protein product [Mycena citricolor]CAK5282016.1 unnamed protein product [Mycena citricolor]CAK5282032.1 unnamed protein product [Mycena citricolor]
MLTETTPLLPSLATAVSVVRERKARFEWLAPLLLITGLARGMSMYARFEGYQHSICPAEPPWSPCGSFTTWLALPTTFTYSHANAEYLRVYFDLWASFASFVVSFLTIGFWSGLGDKRGRRIPLLGALCGLVLGDLVHILLSWIHIAPTDAGDIMSVGIMLEGAVGGGYLGYFAAARAYAFDVAETPISRVTLFGLNDALGLAGFFFGAILGHLAGWRIAYIISASLGLVSLAYAFLVLPESLPVSSSPASSSLPVAGTAMPRRRRRASPLISIVRPITTFLGNGVTKMYLPTFGLAFLLYSFSAGGMDSGLVGYTTFLHSLPTWLVLLTPHVVSLLALLILLPLAAHVYTLKYRTSYQSSELLSVSFLRILTQNAIFIDLISALGIVVFCLPDHAHALYDLLAVFHPLSVIARPGIWALGAGYLVSLGKELEVGRFFGALSVWSGFAEVVSHFFYGPGSEIFWFSTFLLVTSLMTLLLSKSIPGEDEDGPWDD